MKSRSRSVPAKFPKSTKTTLFKPSQNHPVKSLLSLPHELQVRIASKLLGNGDWKDRQRAAAVNRRLRQIIVSRCSKFRKSQVTVDFGGSKYIKSTKLIVNGLERDNASLAERKEMVTTLLAFNQPRQLKLKARKCSPALVDVMKSSQLKTMETLELNLRGVTVCRAILRLPFAQTLCQLQVHARSAKGDTNTDICKLFQAIGLCKNVQVLDVYAKFRGSRNNSAVHYFYKCVEEVCKLPKLRAVRLFDDNQWPDRYLTELLNELPSNMLSTLCLQRAPLLHRLLDRMEESASMHIDTICCLYIGYVENTEELTELLSSILTDVRNCRKIRTDFGVIKVTTEELGRMCDHLVELTGDRETVEVVLDVFCDLWRDNLSKKIQRSRGNSTVVIVHKYGYVGEGCLFSCFEKEAGYFICA